MAEIKKLNPDLIHRANSNSFGGKRGDISEHDYEVYCNRVLEWPVSEEKKQKILDKIYEKHMAILSHEASHVSVIVAGPARYNAKKLDHSDQILSLSSEFVEWFKDLEKQVKAGQVRQTDDAEIARLVEMIEFCDQREEFRPDGDLALLAMKDNAKFVEFFEKLQPKYKWRKNSNLYKLYIASKEGKVKETKRETFFEDENLTAYTMGDRAFIKFTMRPARQLIVALKSRKWWWNSREEAWSTYLNRLDKEWVESISDRYAKYV